tara:strand:- start:128 stop:817 length:690 start_codon:yes stop_codon:yes gene_type:complete
MGFVDRLSGKTAAKAAVKGGEIQSQANLAAAEDAGIAGKSASNLLNPFALAARGGVDNASFLTDPSKQFDFLQNNPLFKMGLDNANEKTLKMSAAQGRLSSGDTLQQLTNNSLLAASPLINNQKQSISELLTMGQNTAANQGSILQNTAANVGNLKTGAAAAQAGGIIGAENARGAGYQNMINLAGQVAGAAMGMPSMGGAPSAPAGAGFSLPAFNPADTAIGGFTYKT